MNERMDCSAKMCTHYVRVYMYVRWLQKAQLWIEKDAVGGGVGDCTQCVLCGGGGGGGGGNVSLPVWIN